MGLPFRKLSIFWGGGIFQLFIELATHQAVLAMHMYHREESFKPKNMPLAPHKVLEQKLLLVIVIENVTGGVVREQFRQ